MRDCDVGEVRIDDLYNLVVVISQLLKLEIKVIQTGNKPVSYTHLTLPTNSRV